MSAQEPTLALTLHLSGESGLSEREQDQAWTRCFEPLFRTIDTLPRLKLGLVFAGELLASWEARHPARLDRVRAWVESGQVELVATPLWEPVLSAVPERDAVAQIVAHALMVKRLFGVRPRGCWLPYRQWDPALPRVFERAEIDWVLVDDLAILRHHPGRPDPWGVWWTERGGHAVRMLAADARALEMAGDVPVRDLLLYARGRAVQGAVVQFWALRTHRFGLARGRDAIEDAEWLAGFLSGLERAEHLRLDTPSRAATRVAERGRTYLPSCAPPDRDHPWERHLLEHPAADRLHKKMLRVSRQLGRWSNDVAKGEARPDPDGQIQAERYLLRAQGADAYRPGDDPRRRWRAWRDLVRAERQILTCRGLLSRAVAETADVSTSGRARVVLRSASGCCIVDPAVHAGVVELSLFDVAANVIDPWLGRRAPEVASPESPSGPFGIGALLDPEDEPAAFVESITLEGGSALPPPKWTLSSLERDEDGTAKVSFVADPGAVAPILTLTKTYVLRSSPRLDWTLDLLNVTSAPIRGRVSLDLHLQLGPTLDGVDLQSSDESWPASEPHRTAREVAELELGVLATFAGRPIAELPLHTTALSLGLRRPARIGTAPVRSAGSHGETYEQGLLVRIEWSFELVGGERDRLGVSLEVTP